MANVEYLNYNFNIQLHKFNLCIRDRLSELDRRLAVAWVNKLKSEVQTIEEAQLRNDVLFYLVTCVEAGLLKPPFRQNPPHGRLINLKSIMPTSLKYSLDKPPQKHHTEIFERSPDKGAFLASQPVPRSGAFCYLAILSRTPDPN